jgi:hypothetical protein
LIVYGFIDGASTMIDLRLPFSQMRISFSFKRLPATFCVGGEKDEAFELFICDNDSKSAPRKRLVIIIIVKRQMLQKFNYRPSESTRSKGTRMLQQELVDSVLITN